MLWSAAAAAAGANAGGAAKPWTCRDRDQETSVANMGKLGCRNPPQSNASRHMAACNVSACPIAQASALRGGGGRNNAPGTSTR